MSKRPCILPAILLVSFLSVSAQMHTADMQRSNPTLLDNGVTRTLRHIYANCAESEEVFKCFKVQGAKLLGRALKVQNIAILEGISIVKKLENETRTARSRVHNMNLNNRDLDRLSSKSLDTILMERFISFIQSRQFQISLPRLLSFGQRNSQDLMKYVMNIVQGITQIFEDDTDSSEGRDKKKDDKKYLGPFIAAVMLKAAILKMAYHSIAILAGKALIVGKIALIISAIIGLKKLVSHDSEKTTYEIVKHPQVQQSHTYSSSHAGEYESGHEGGAYHRSIDDEMLMQDKAYSAWVPTKTAT